MNDQISLSRAGSFRVVAATLMLATWTASAAAVALAETSRSTPIQLESAVLNSDLTTPNRAVTTAPTRSTSKAPRSRVRAHNLPPSKAALTLETKKAARKVVLSDHAVRRQQASVSTTKNIAPHVMLNLREAAPPPVIEMGDRPARSQSLCGDGKNRRFAELDSKTVAALLPEFGALRPRTVCARRGVLIADYAFK